MPSSWALLPQHLPPGKSRMWSLRTDNISSLLHFPVKLSRLPSSPRLRMEHPSPPLNQTPQHTLSCFHLLQQLSRGPFWNPYMVFQKCLVVLLLVVTWMTNRFTAINQSFVSSIALFGGAFMVVAGIHWLLFSLWFSVKHMINLSRTPSI